MISVRAARGRGSALAHARRVASPEACLALGAVLAVSVAQAVFLFVGCDWELCADEAEYWAWSRRLDWSYFAKGPLIAALIRVGTEAFGGLSLAATGTLMPAVRLPALILGALTAWGVFRLAQRTLRSDRAGLYAVLLLPAVPLFRIGGLLMTIDTPLLCCWAWAAVWSYRAIVDGERAGWVVAGLLGASGVLAKYTMLAFPASVGLFLLVRPEHRRQLVRPWFWVMAGMTALGMAPILLWNAGHGWVGAGQMADRVGLTNRWHPGRLKALADFLGCEVAVWGGTWWLVGLLALRRAFAAVCERNSAPEGEASRSDRDGLAYLLCLWGLTWAACVGVGVMGETEANWGAPGYVSLLALIGRWLDRGPLRDGLRRPVGRAGVALLACWGLGMAGLTLLQHTEWAYPLIGRLVPTPTDRWPAPLKDLDPTNRMRGCRALVPEVERRLAALRAEGRDPFLLTPTPYLASLLTFYLPDHPEVHCLSFSWTPGRPVNQHDLWHPNPRFDLPPFEGRPALVVEDAHFWPNYAASLVRRGWIARTEQTERVVAHRLGLPISAWDLSTGRDFRGLPAVIPFDPPRPASRSEPR